MPFKRPRDDSSGGFNVPESSTNSSSKRTASSPSAAPPPPNSFLRQSAAMAAKPTSLVPPAARPDGSSQVRLGEFLEECFFCRRSIARECNIFMYRSCAFCSEECRDRQISIDDRKEKMQDQEKPNQTAPLARPPGMNNSEGDHAGSF
ncbi:FCS-Like Zinc finger 6-like [Ipomoea triloba]|uniref:FCS-Like Zinc finger 6-like n=1 Tax=Ipomoea triloba TaxID=35885 RepID=UPI00125E4DAF|nr:FCS-Like Zinc finger 6-like [Ipomoea triloba]XP_031114113.1 FCS-Like Zinc finger 6-like [Ipomoea triloba]